MREGGREGRREWEGERKGEKYDDFVILTVDVASIYMYTHVYTCTCIVAFKINYFPTE